MHERYNTEPVYIRLEAGHGDVVVALRDVLECMHFAVSAGELPAFEREDAAGIREGAAGRDKVQ